MAQKIAAVVMASPTRNSAALSTYVSSEKDDQDEGERFVAASGINGCIPEFAEHQMRDNRKHWGKDGTRRVEKNVGGHKKLVTEGQYVQAYHVIQSFARDGDGALDPTDPQAWERAHELGVELAKKVAENNRYASVYTQIDGQTGCIHNHLVIDSVDKTTGRSFDSANVKHKNLVATHDAMLAEQGYEQANPEYKNQGTKTAQTLEKSELRELANYRKWEAGGKQGDEPFSVAILKHRIRQTLADTDYTTFDGFVEAAENYNVDVEQRGENGRGISYVMHRQDKHGSGQDTFSGTRDRRRASKLGTDYMMEAVESAIERNKQLQAQQCRATPMELQPAATPASQEVGFNHQQGAQDEEIQRLDELVELLPITTNSHGDRLADDALAILEGDIAWDEAPMVRARWRERGSPVTNREREDQERRERESAVRAAQQEAVRQRVVAQQAVSQQQPIKEPAEAQETVEPLPTTNVGGQQHQRAIPVAAQIPEATEPAAEVANDRKRKQQVAMNTAEQPEQATPRKSKSAQQQAMAEMQRRMAAMGLDDHAEDEQQLS